MLNSNEFERAGEITMVNVRLNKHMEIIRTERQRHAEASAHQLLAQFGPMEHWRLVILMRDRGFEFEEAQSAVSAMLCEGRLVRHIPTRTLVLVVVDTRATTVLLRKPSRWQRVKAWFTRRMV